MKVVFEESFIITYYFVAVMEKLYLLISAAQYPTIIMNFKINMINIDFMVIGVLPSK